MIHIRLNGEDKELEFSPTVHELLDHLNLDPTHLAVAINHDILPRSEFKERKLKEGDIVDIVRPVAGG